MRPPALQQGRRRALLALGAGSLAGIATSTPAADLVSLVATARLSVLPVGTFSPTGNPRFTFRGTGFVIGEGNLVATNFHVLPDAAESNATTQVAVIGSRTATEGQARLARVVATDRLRDLALLQIDGPPLPALVLAEPGVAREGLSIALMGFPIGGTLGFSVVTHRGIIASITSAALPAPTARQLDARAVSRLREGNFEVLQLDATAYPGNSGGPVLDIDSGQVVGIVNQVLIRASRESALTNPTGITYAIPIKLMRELQREYEQSRSAPPAAPQTR